VGRERFDAWLRAYFDRHAFQPMTSARFLADLRRI
jgi:aminopeptidase N